jgi:hypothetical protein
VSAPALRPGREALWHRTSAPRPRPVLVLARLPEKVRVLDLVASTPRRLVTREVYPRNLTAQRRQAGGPR